MLPEGIELRPMTETDLPEILRIIRDHDEDDFEAARESYDQYGIEEQYVLTARDKVIGMTGAGYMDRTDRSYQLSWTYIDRRHAGRGLGSAMLRELIEILTARGVRKLFVTTSDLADRKRGEVYRAAIRCYEEVGFRLESKHEDYYAPGESRLTYGRRIGPLYATRPVFEPDSAGVALVDVGEIPETDDAYYVEWDYTDEGAMFHPEDLRRMIDQVAEWNGRCIFVGFPSDLPHFEEALKRQGFSQCGRLMDFYQDGLD